MEKLCTDSRFLDLDTSWSCKLHAPAALTPGKESPVPIGQEAGRPQSRSGRHEENILDPTGTPIPTPQVAIPTPVELNIFNFQTIPVTGR
jgi:hypothetical protein